MKDMVGQGVGDDCRRLPGLHSCELIFLEIGVDPQTMRGTNRQQMGALRDIGTNPCRAVADIAVNRLPAMTGDSKGISMASENYLTTKTSGPAFKLDAEQDTRSARRSGEDRLGEARSDQDARPLKASVDDQAKNISRTSCGKCGKEVTVDLSAVPAPQRRPA